MSNILRTYFECIIRNAKIVSSYGCVKFPSISVLFDMSNILPKTLNFLLMGTACGPHIEELG